MKTATVLEVMVAGHKVRALLWPLSQYADQANALLAEHPMLTPEIQAANTHVELAITALERAVGFLDAKMDSEAA